MERLRDPAVLVRISSSWIEINGENNLMGSETDQGFVTFWLRAYKALK